MASKTIDWGDGTGEKITLTYNAASGNQTVQVSSAKNTTTSKRSKTITFATTAGGSVTRTITVTQKGLTESTVKFNPSAFVSGTYKSISGQTNPVGKSETSTSYATVNLTNGSRATTNAIWSFDCSSIPEGAEIVSVTCKAKCSINNTQSSRISTRKIQLYSNTTAKGSAYTVANSTTAFSITAGTWTRAELQNARIRLDATRGTSSTTTSYYFRFYGATLTVTYRI